MTTLKQSSAIELLEKWGAKWMSDRWFLNSIDTSIEVMTFMSGSSLNNGCCSEMYPSKEFGAVNWLVARGMVYKSDATGWQMPAAVIRGKVNLREVEARTDEMAAQARNKVANAPAKTVEPISTHGMMFTTVPTETPTDVIREAVGMPPQSTERTFTAAEVGNIVYPMDVDGYHSLAAVLHRAYLQAAKGKGHERHANGEPFDEQVMADMARRFGVGALLGQAFKKSEESQRLPHDRAIAELLGAINYLAGAVIRMEKVKNDIPF